MPWTDSSGTNPAPLRDLETVFSRVVNIVLGAAGIVLFVMLVMGGIKYLTSGGDPKATEAAQKTLTSAIVGLIIVITAFLILRFVSAFTGSTGILNFTVYQP
jgi:hypothetical protein